MRRKKNEVPNFKRVESVEIIKLSDTNRITELCEDGFVYDIEIEDNHNYLAEDILVHNCSAFPKPSLRATQLRDIKKKYTILMSGTPMPNYTINFILLRKTAPLKILLISISGQDLL
jgi:hypothetical protein